MFVPIVGFEETRGELPMAILGLCNVQLRSNSVRRRNDGRLWAAVSPPRAPRRMPRRVCTVAVQIAPGVSLYSNSEEKAEHGGAYFMGCVMAIALWEE